MIGTAQDETDVAPLPGASETPLRWLVIGMGSFAFGKERRAVTALKHMTRVRPHFLTTIWEDGSVSELLRANGFEFTPTTIGYLGRARLRWTLTNVLSMPRLFVTALKKYHGERCTGVLILALQPFANLLPVLWCLKVFSGARLVFYLGDIPANTSANRFVCRTMKSLANAIIVNSEGVRRGLEGVGVSANSVKVIYNGVPLQRFNRAQPFRWREQFGWNTEAILVGYAGQLSENKGVWDFLAAAEEVLRSNDQYRFVLIGKVDNENECYRRIAAHIKAQDLRNKVVFTGWVSEMEHAYASLDMLVVPSRHEEAGSNVIIEAMASGVPVIATRTGGNPELLTDGETGFLVSTKKPLEIRQKLLLLGSVPDLRHKLGRAAKLRATLQFDAGKNAAAVEQIMLAVGMKI
jgi:glycosyltransferase involved in cell wall biosynthesis